MMEDRRDSNVQIDRRGQRLIESSIVAGSCRSFPQESWVLTGKEND